MSSKQHKVETDNQPENKETIQEVLVRLEKAVIAKNKSVDDLKDKLYQAQEEKFKAFQELSGVKEQYLITLVDSLRNKQDKNTDKNTDKTEN